MKTLVTLLAAFIVMASSAIADTTISFQHLKRDSILDLGKFGHSGVLINTPMDGECLIVRQVGTNKCLVPSSLMDYSAGIGTVRISLVTPNFQEPAVLASGKKIAINVLDTTGAKYAVSGYDAKGKLLFRITKEKTLTIQITKPGVRSIVLDSKDHKSYLKSIVIGAGAIKAL